MTRGGMLVSNPIPVSMPDLQGNEQAYAADAVASSWISSSGRYLDRFQHEFAEACGCRFAFGTSSGTTALHLALAALGVGPGDEVIVPSMTYVATANAVTYCGATPVFVDIEPSTWCIDPAAIEQAITPRTKGIIPVHLLGHPADMDPILELARIHGLWVVEDAAQATFATYRGRVVGSLGDAAAFSFFGNKVLTSGEGGAVTFSNPRLEQRIAMLRGQGMDPQRRYYFPIVGFNYRMTNVAAAILCAQMERRQELLQRRQRLLDIYAERLTDIPGIALRDDATWATTTPWMASCLVDAGRFGCTRDELADSLKRHGIDTRPMFIPIHRLPPYQSSARKRRTALPVTDRLSALGLMLPTYSQLAAEDAVRICDAIRTVGREKLCRRRSVAAATVMGQSSAAARRVA
jgi:perosamine synthetase